MCDVCFDVSFFFASKPPRARAVYTIFFTRRLQQGKKTHMRALFAAFMVLAAAANALQVTPLQAATAACPGGSPGIAINVTAKEFYASFASIFRLSDGSTIRPPSAERMESVRYMQELMYSVGISVNESASAASNGMYEGDILQICGQDVVDLILLAVVGNFVTSPSDPSLSSPSTGGAASTVPSVVIDTYTGRLVVRMPYDAVRGYFIEALLVISIIVITRLSFVRNVTYKITLPPSAAALPTPSSAAVAQPSSGPVHHQQQPAAAAAAAAHGSR